jgi:SDR family mycofactocin-dependent oxidoreductase
MGLRLGNKVALVTGAARGIGRACALRFAEEGADVALIDVATPIPTVPYGGANEEQLNDAADEVTRLGRTASTFQLDVRDDEGLRSVVSEVIDQFGRIDILLAAAGIESYGRAWELTPEQWQLALDINLTGVWNTAKAVAPHMRAQAGGVMILIGSVNSHTPAANSAHYVASKHGLLGLARSLALELGPNMVRVNTLAPAATATPMGSLAQAKDDDDRDRIVEQLKARHALPVAVVEPIDIANAALFLASDEARYITGVSLPVDLGRLLKSGV